MQSDDQKKQKVGLGKKVILTLLVVAIVSVVIPVFMPDGLENYEGAQKKAAQAAISAVYNVSTGAPIPLLMKAHVDEVRATTQDEAVRWCDDTLKFSSDVNDARHYTVTVSYRWFFGFTSSTVARYGCRDSQS